MKLVLFTMFLISLIATLVLGARLIRSGRRAGGVPELVYGLALFISGIGSIVRLVVYAVIGPSEETRLAVVFASVVSVVTLAVMTTGLRLIYHPLKRWPWALQAALVALSLVATWQLAVAPIATGIRPLPQMANDIASTGMMVWGAGAASAHWLKLRRRLALGLVEPLVVERFKLWALGFLVGGLTSASLWLLPLTAGIRIVDVPWIMLTVNALVLVMTGLVWATFYPPEFHRRRIEARAAT